MTPCFICAGCDSLERRVNGHHSACPRCERPDMMRTVKAVNVLAFDPDGGAPNGLDFAAGSCQAEGEYLRFTCPGCRNWCAGRCSNPKRPETWEIVAGTLDTPETLTLAPSIRAGCCGWHGYLRDGVFLPC